MGLWDGGTIGRLQRSLSALTLSLLCQRIQVHVCECPQPTDRSHAAQALALSYADSLFAENMVSLGKYCMVVTVGCAVGASVWSAFWYPSLWNQGSLVFDFWFGFQKWFSSSFFNNVFFDNFACVYLFFDNFPRVYLFWSCHTHLPTLSYLFLISTDPPPSS